MPRVAAAFFLTAALFLLGGMFVGLWMGVHQDFRLAPAHAHINLVGWVTMALYGTFYALTAKTMQPKLAWTHYGVATLGAAIQGPALGAMILNGEKPWLTILSIGEHITALALLIFLYAAFREAVRARPSAE